MAEGLHSLTVVLYCWHYIADNSLCLGSVSVLKLNISADDKVYETFGPVSPSSCDQCLVGIISIAD